TMGRDRGGKIRLLPTSAAGGGDRQPDAAGRQQLDRILCSVTFRQVDRLKRFLSFIVEEALAGRGDQLKEYVIGVQVFDKDASHELEYFCGGLRQELIHRLAGVDGLRVVAAEPAAALLLAGSVRRSGNRLRITVHLVDSASASYLWSESIDTEADDTFGAQE